MVTFVHVVFVEGKEGPWDVKVDELGIQLKAVQRWT